MSTSSPIPPLDELARIVARERPGRSLEDVERTLLARGSSWWIEALDIRLDDGTVWPLVFKDLAREMPGSDSLRVKPDRIRDPKREPWVYRQLLRGRPGGGPRAIDFASDSHGGSQLLMEAVEGVPLSEVGAGRAWRAAAEWLGRFHLWTETLRPGEDTPLLRHGPELHEWWWERARSSLRHQRRTRPESAAAIQEAHARAVETAFRGPLGIIHGEYYASNVLWESTGGGQIWPVDWEMAAFGPSLLDLAALLTGRWEEPVAVAMIRAYRHGRLAAGGSCLPLDRFLRGLSACRLLLAVQWLGWNGQWTPPSEHRTDWLDEAVRSTHELMRDNR